ncbi:hypothetical protein SAMN05421858_0091 [Haladaptatus litoreus]|uniref:Uncharacterized protein n=1 Tax=Haladaptatus litoreus TaxID=553468 RepID=A0A1N6UTH5_9EURY|nr:hypothetical protein SAMN05421858_0091 [Haladaptatus litoreus]
MTPKQPYRGLFLRNRFDVLALIIAVVGCFVARFTEHELCDSCTAFEFDVVMNL